MPGGTEEQLLAWLAAFGLGFSCILWFCVAVAVFAHPVECFQSVARKLATAFFTIR